MRGATSGRPGGPRPTLPRPDERVIVQRRGGYRGPGRPPARKPRRRLSFVGRRLRATVHKRPRQLADAGFLTGKRYEIEVSEDRLVLRAV